ncbi:FAD-dependent monooxygenase [Pseudonocardia adelaidensis]|uniref:FAD-dependent oxidoreductase n=1 Tax=Pseudonocardia adelaidensis TaxID=648754 RepID=A0ABP9NLS0_9PSEU
MTGLRQETTQVLVVGGGPVGMALALDLAQRNVDCMVVDASDGKVRHPKVSTVGPRSMELFRRWGLAGEIRSAGWPGDHPLDVAWVTQVGGYEIYRFERGTADTRPELRHTPEPDQICPAHWLNPLLMRAVGTYPDGPLRLGHRVGGFEQDDDGVTASITDMTTAESFTVRASYLVACDGAASPIRTACGIDAPARHEAQVFRNILFRAPELPRQLAAQGRRPAMVYFLMLSAALRYTLRSLDGRDTFNMVVSGDDDPASLVEDAIAFDTPTELLSDSTWHLTHRVADRYRHGRVLLAGDAAHTLSPSGGFGLNTGIGDAADLGWKLGAELSGWAGSGMLASYETERRPVALRSLEAANTNLRRTMNRELPADLRAATPEGEQARAEMASRLQKGGARSEFDAPNVHFGHGYSSPLVVGESVDISADWRPGSDPGFRAAHAWVRPGVSTLDLFGRGFVLLCFDGSDRLDGVERAFAERRVPLEVTRCEDAEIAKLYRFPFVLVRPDGHVAWRGDRAPDDPGKLADVVRGAA